MEENRFFNRDLSWLGFNARVLNEAAGVTVPLLEKIKFLSIFSSNLDEFYRVRMPVINALKKIGENPGSDLDAIEHAAILEQVKLTIQQQQAKFGAILARKIIPQLNQRSIHLVYNEVLPEFLSDTVSNFFLAEVLAFLQPVNLKKRPDFFPENNKLYFLIKVKDGDSDTLVALNIPSDRLPRFSGYKEGDKKYVVFLDDVIRANLQSIFPGEIINGCYSFKVTRDADLDLKDDYRGELSNEIEKQLFKRDYGLATRLLYETKMPGELLEKLQKFLGLTKATSVEGGRYHNLKDFTSFPVSSAELEYKSWVPINRADAGAHNTVAAQILRKDMIVHAPYQSYDMVLRFFNEAAINPDVKEIYVTLYRVASDSLIAHALMSAAKNGKQVHVVMELKARFDEANNLKWAKAMKKAGVKIIYSVTALKVHAKVALIKTKQNGRMLYTGLLATGNLNETTAKFYTDHILFTSNKDMLREMELLFIFLSKREKPDRYKGDVDFKHLLVAQFNLQTRFLELIDREIEFAKQGLPAAIKIKLNNLEEHHLISKLYEASQAGVKIALIVRSICCLIPGVEGMSDNITVRRVIDRYLEHGRIFIFNNNGSNEVFMGSADWMNRNIYHRIEVCFPVYDPAIKNQMIAIINLLLADNVKAVTLNQHMENVDVPLIKPHVEAQLEIYNLVSAAS